ncbi:hypothetical protein DBR47_21715 [Paucibacter sp. KBW04]|uniref:chalcone isomerase family protein n=1 Tax=Paucibacter sp. KBW04 TaxID=2153361 RepID=UPI000F57A4E0|nr:chalcone isomerase family protein [Paucibacter sp. KBW04]RQO54695.1 hypothetical protein DBR47_21715 [Paucibacter sp. KBW04]
MPLAQRRLFLLLGLGLGLSPLRAEEESPEKLQAQAQMRFFGLLIYDIRLWSRQAVNTQNWANLPLRLELLYARSLSGREIAKRSLVEMRRQAEIPEAKAKQWLAEMEAAFPDVTAGQRLSGQFLPGQGMQFFVNDKLCRRIADPEFARLFVGIWLAPQTSEPDLRRRLLEAGGGDAKP